MDDKGSNPVGAMPLLGCVRGDAPFTRPCNNEAASPPVPALRVVVGTGVMGERVNRLWAAGGLAPPPPTPPPPAAVPVSANKCAGLVKSRVARMGGNEGDRPVRLFVLPPAAPLLPAPPPDPALPEKEYKSGAGKGPAAGEGL